MDGWMDEWKEGTIRGGKGKQSRKKKEGEREGGGAKGRDGKDTWHKDKDVAGRLVAVNIHHRFYRRLYSRW
jgi:hypothetical protein